MARNLVVPSRIVLSYLVAYVPRNGDVMQGYNVMSYLTTSGSRDIS